MVTVVVTGVLKEYVKGRQAIAVEPGASIKEMLAALGIPSEMVAMAVVDGRQCFKEFVPAEGATVTLLPLVGGG
jgi:sulfur carrier protein ThiS